MFGVEEAVVQKLRGVVVDELGANLVKVVAGVDEAGRLGDSDAVDVLHHHDVLGAEAHVGHGAGDELAVLVVAVELLEVARLHEKVGLLAEGLPELFHHVGEVQELVALDEGQQVPHERAHDVDVLRHHLLHVRALHLDGHVGPAGEARPVHLRHRGRAQRMLADGVEDGVEARAVLLLEHGDDRLVGHGLGVGAQLGELAAEALGQDLGAHGEDLAGLHEGGTQLLEQATELDGRDAAEHVVLAHDAEDL